MTTAIGRPSTRSSSGVDRYTLRIAVTDALVIVWAVIGAQPVGLTGLFLARWIWRRWLGAQRAEGRLCDTMIVVGDRGHLAGLIGALRDVPEAGFTVVGACCSDGTTPIAGVPIVGTEHQ